MPNTERFPASSKTVKTQPPYDTDVDADLDVDNGSFDAASFSSATLSDWRKMAAVIDHTLLKPEATHTQVENLCDEAVRYKFACAMINPVWTATAAAMLAGTGIPVGVVIGFPLGASLASTLRQEAQALVKLGARELDMVISVGQLRSGEYKAVERTIRGAADVAHHHGAILKVILETCLLSVEEKLRASEIAIAAGTDFLKTSTGFST